MLSTSPKQKECIAEARRLFRQGETKAAQDVLFGDRYDHGIDSEVDAELHRFFPIPPELVAKLALHQQQLDDPDEKARRKASRGISRFVLGTVSRKIGEFLRQAETMTFFIRNIDHPDPAVQEDMTVCIARALSKYIHDDRAYEPLTRMTTAKSANTRAWAIEGLAALTDDMVPWALKMLNDKSLRVRDAAYSAMVFVVAGAGGGTLNRPALSPVGRKQIREAMVTHDLKAPVEERAARAYLLSAVAEPAQLSVLEEWFKKDKSKLVREKLKGGIDRLQAKRSLA